MYRFREAQLMLRLFVFLDTRYVIWYSLPYD